MPNPNPNMSGLKPGQSPGRKPLNRDRYNVSLDPEVSDRVSLIADNLGISKPKVIELLAMHAMGVYPARGYDKAEIKLILKNAKSS